MGKPSAALKRLSDIPSSTILLALTSFSVILWEIGLTRIYSAILYYHFAFLAVSVAMFGLTLGAVLVYADPWPPLLSRLEREPGHLAAAAGLLMVLDIILQLSLPLYPAPAAFQRYLLFTYILSALPFVPAGILTCLMLTRLPRVGYLYAANLAGAAAACALFPLLLSWLGGPGTILFAGAAALIGAGIQLHPRRPRLAASKLGLALGLGVFAMINLHTQWLRIRWTHDGERPKPMYESWNAFSRVTVNPSILPGTPFAWGVAPENLRKFRPGIELWLEIDSGAGTPITRFDGDLRPLEYLRYDITGFAHRLRSPASTAILGAGGGRDILTALAYRQPRITALEVNPDIAELVNGDLGAFTGHLDRMPQVHFIVDEARSYLARTPERFDIIQASLLDTAAATAAGAYAFVESGLYTVEAWKILLARLTPRGVLSFSRWYYGSTVRPVEVFRLLSLACAALRAEGISDPVRHLLLVRVGQRVQDTPHDFIATLLVSPQPFSPEDLAKARQACAELSCEVILDSRESKEPLFAEILNARAEASEPMFNLDISAPTDDRPYFFFHARLLDSLPGKASIPAFGGSAFNLPAVEVLVRLTLMSLLLALALLAPPLVWKTLRSASPRAWPEFAPAAGYFAAIGLAFMFVEIGFIQRFSMLLGQPAYGFIVVLFGLFLSSALGSLGSERIRRFLGGSKQWSLLALLIPVLLAAEIASRAALREASGAPAWARIGLAWSCILAPLFLMGFALPMGMRKVQERGGDQAAWCWAVNGAASVIASVLAMECSLAFGIRMTLVTGVGLYALAAALYVKLDKASP